MTQQQTSAMNRSWLVQRLTRPREVPGLLGPDSPFSFGGGLRNGGLPAEAMNILRPIFGFDYMGAAEFEFGAVPKALSELASSAHEEPRKSKLTAFSFDITLADVPASWRAPKDAPAPDGDVAIFVLCQRDHAEEVRRRVTAWATGDERLKEMTRLPSALRPEDDWDSDVAGWLELDNGFMFFTDRSMWAATCAVFAVEVAA